jgi:hypothetical protein
VIYFLAEIKPTESYKIISGSFPIDPPGAGSTGKSDWDGWIQRLKANEEDFRRHP